MNSTDPAIEGMNRAIAAVERKYPGWERDAIEMVRRYALENEFFRAEQVRRWAEETGLLAVNPSAWGSVMCNAASNGIIHKVAKQTSHSKGAHGKLMTLWRRGKANGAFKVDSDTATLFTEVERLKAILEKHGISY